MANQGKALAGSTPEHAVNRPGSKPSSQTYFPTGKSFNRAGNDGGLGKVEFVYCTVHRVNFHGCSDIEACLFEAQAHTARACEKVYSDRSAHATLPLSSCKLQALA
jgi:hypothetical protein